MRRVVAVLLAGLMLFTPTFQAVGDDIRVEVKGDLYDRLALPKGVEPGDVNLFQGKFGAGMPPPVGACGINAISSFLEGLASLAELGQLENFINNWQSAATALSLYALATYLPVAKEVLLGANMLSNFVAQLRGFSCSQALEAIKEFNYQDSYLIKRCIANRLGISANDVDMVRSKSPNQWYSAYRYCLNQARLVDVLGGTGETNKYLSFISPRSAVRCALGVNKTPTPDDIARADLQTRAKYFLYMIMPDISLDSEGFLRVRTIEIVDAQTGQRRPATLVEVVNIHIEDFERNYKELIEKLKKAIRYDMNYDEALRAAEVHLKDFETKYGITVMDMAPTLILVLKMRDYIEREINGEVGLARESSYDDLDDLDRLISGELKMHFMDKVRESLSWAMTQKALEMQQAEAMRRAVGSYAGPGSSDGCLTGASASN